MNRPAACRKVIETTGPARNSATGSKGDMVKRVFRTLLLFVGPCLILSACASGSSLTVPGDLTRPKGVAAPRAGAPQAVIVDFSFAAAPDGVVGRDYDHARPIVWKGEPGKAMADLVAGVLGEKGVATVRRGADPQAADAVPVRIFGQLLRFDVNTRRTGNLTVITESVVTLAITLEGPGISGPMEKTVTSSASLSDLFVTPDDLREALLSTANTVAEETARILLEAKVVSPSS
ncbi:MAG: hypothetical protein H6Q79_1509 [Deltaproteobacteria bacterium]|nr:hypothetical protein [Deltaproteobacteria bacterium]